MYLSDGSPSKYHLVILVNIKFRVPYSQRYLFNAIPDTNHNANPTNPNRYSKGNPNPNPTNPNTRYRIIEPSDYRYITISRTDIV